MAHHPASSSLPPSTDPAPRGVISALAITSMILAIFGCLLFPLGGAALGLLALVLGLIAQKRINNRPAALGGQGFATTGVALGVCSAALTMTMLLVSCKGGPAADPKTLSRCSANLMGIAKSCVIYAADNNETFPMVLPNKGNRGYSLAVASGPSGFNNSSELLSTDGGIYSSKGTLHDETAGSPAACLWVLVLRDNISPKQLVCPADLEDRAPFAAIDRSGNFFANIQDQRSLSYSIAYPWSPRGDAAPYWRNPLDASIPLMSDMALFQSNAGASAPKAFNSPVHGGAGQNVVFADTHAEFKKTVTIGQNSESIFANLRADGDQNVVADVAAENADPAVPGISFPGGPPYNTFMIPTRDAAGTRH